MSLAACGVSCVRDGSSKRTLQAGQGAADALEASDSCWEPTGVVEQENWKFVGEGRGAYQTVQYLNYVGEGAGSFTREEPRPSGSLCQRHCCVSCVVVLVLLGVGCWVASAVLPQDWVQAATAPLGGQRPSLSMASAAPAAPAPVYARSITEPKYRCALPSTEGPLQGASLAAANEAEIGDWSEDKRLWCCRTLGVACPSSTLRPFDCDVGASGAWAANKTAWCCRNTGKGCSTAAASTSTSAEMETTTAATTSAVNLLARTTLPPAPYNCLVDLDSWQTAWSGGKREWCCAHYRRGCPRSGGGSSGLAVRL